MGNALSPGARGWINKYFDLAEKEVFSLKKKRPRAFDEAYYLHLLYARSGIVFGYPDELIFANQLDSTSWTTDEKLKLLLFEAHILIFQQKYGSVLKRRNQFLDSLVQFYSTHRSKGLRRYLRFLSSRSREHLLERILGERIYVSAHMENWLYFHAVTNVLCFTDVILYQSFVNDSDSRALDKFPEVAESALTAYRLAAVADGNIEGRERELFRVFLLSANFSRGLRKTVQKRLSGKKRLEDLVLPEKDTWLHRRFLLDISVLTIFFSHEAVPEELEYLDRLMRHLELPERELEESIVMVENFVLRNASRAEFLQDASSLEKVYSGLTRRWIKILSRNKDKLAAELRESKELVFLIKKSTTQDLSKEEKEKVRTQFLDIVKSMPTLAIFMLPGGAVLLPIVLKIIPDLIPSAFRENEISDKDTKDLPGEKHSDE